HILLEGWSAALVLEEVFAFYRAFSRDRDIDLKPRRPYRDYILWLQRQDLSRAEAYWREALKGFSAPTALPLQGASRDSSSTGRGVGRGPLPLTVSTRDA